MRMALGESIFSRKGRKAPERRPKAGPSPAGGGGGSGDGGSLLASRQTLSTIAAISVAVAIGAVGFSAVARNDAAQLRERIQSESVEVVRTSGAVSAGERFEAGKLQRVRVAEGAVPSGVVSDLDAVVGKVASHDIASGAIVSATEIRNTLGTATEYTLDVATDRVVASVQVGGTAAAPSKVSVGDRVDVVAFGQGGGETVAEDVPVIAVDGDTHATGVGEYTRVQLEVTKEAAEKMSALSDSVRLTQRRATDEGGEA